MLLGVVLVYDYFRPDIVKEGLKKKNLSQPTNPYLPIPTYQSLPTNPYLPILPIYVSPPMSTYLSNYVYLPTRLI